MLLQFLLEALFLSLLGGLLGVVISVFLTYIIAIAVPGMEQASAPVSVIFLSLGFTCLVGVAFGLGPALKASKMNPVDSLRYE